MDLEALQGDIADRRAQRDDDIPDATSDTVHRPQHSHAYYRKQRERR